MSMSMEVLRESTRNSYHYMKERVKDGGQYIGLEKKLCVVGRQSCACGIKVTH